MSATKQGSILATNRNGNEDELLLRQAAGALDTQVVQSLVMQMRQVIDSLDEDCKREYLTAVVENPDLVRSETPFIIFLRTDDYDPIKAAGRFVSYWKYRKQIYGKERWLLPLNCTGTGALDAGAIRVLRSGLMAHASRPDSSPIMLIDTTRLGKCVPTTQDIFQYTMYFATIVSNEMKDLHAAGDAGIIIIHKVARGHQLLLVPGLRSLVRDALPCKVQTRTIVATVNANPHLREYLSYKASQMIDYNSDRSVPIVQCDLMQGWGSMLDEFKLSRSCLPISLGGYLQDDFHNEYVRARMSIEDCMAGAPPIANARIANHRQLAHVTHHPNFSCFEAASTATSRTRNITTTATRLQGAMVVQSPQQQKPEKAPSPGRRKRSSPPLESSSSSSSAVSASTEDQEYLRNRNTVYCRRWVQKQQRLRQSLSQECGQLRAQQEQLRTEHDRLNALLERAMSLVPLLDATAYRHGDFETIG